MNQFETNSSSNFEPMQGNLILTATILAAGMVFLDGTIITVALEQIQKEFNVSVSGLQWLLDIYLLFLTVPILVAGSLSDRYGRKKIFNIGLIGFTVASTACGTAGSILQLNLARIFQGLFGAMMLPGSLAILNATFPPEIRGKTVGIWATFTPLMSALGPLLGGWLVDNLSWRVAFYINLPLGLIALFLSMRYIPESKSADLPETLDWLGAILVTLGLGCLIFGLIEGPQQGWSFSSVTAIITSIILLMAFGFVESNIAHPMIPISLFKNRTFSGINLMTFILYFAMSGVLFFMPLLLQQTYKLSATRTGFLLMPVVILLGGMSQWSGGIADKYGPRLQLIVGPIVIAIGLFMVMIPGVEINLWFSWLSTLSYETQVFLAFLPAAIVFGAGLGITTAPLTSVSLGAVPTELSGLASGVGNAVSRAATMLAVAVLGTLMVLQFGVSLERETRAIPLSIEARTFLIGEQLKLGGAQPPPGLSPELTSRVQRAIAQSFVDSFRVIMGLCGILALLSSLITIISIKNGSAEETPMSWDKREIPTTPHL